MVCWDRQTAFLPGLKAGVSCLSEDEEEPVDSILRRLELAVNGKLTNAAIMLFGREPQRFFINTTTRVGRFKGRDIIIGDEEISGNLIQQFTRAEERVKSFIDVRYEISADAMQESFQRKEIWDYPLLAIREALLNALIHRDYFSTDIQTQIRVYDDAIRFHNPGSLPQGITIEMLKTEHYSPLRKPPHSKGILPRRVCREVWLWHWANRGRARRSRAPGA